VPFYEKAKPGWRQAFLLCKNCKIEIHSFQGTVFWTQHVAKLTFSISILWLKEISNRQASIQQLLSVTCALVQESRMYDIFLTLFICLRQLDFLDGAIPSKGLVP
jgi:hypothetical protein